MSNLPIPVIRQRLYELAVETGIEELRELADASHRNPSVRKSPRRLPKLTDEVKAQIHKLANDHPDMPMRDIARATNTDQGRVSEVLNGLR